MDNQKVMFSKHFYLFKADESNYKLKASVQIKI